MYGRQGTSWHYFPPCLTITVTDHPRDCTRPPRFVRLSDPYHSLYSTFICVCCMPREEYVSSVYVVPRATHSPRLIMVRCTTGIYATEFQPQQDSHPVLFSVSQFGTRHGTQWPPSWLGCRYWLYVSCTNSTTNDIVAIITIFKTVLNSTVAQIHPVTVKHKKIHHYIQIRSLLKDIYDNFMLWWTATEQIPLIVFIYKSSQPPNNSHRDIKKDPSVSSN